MKRLRGEGARRGKIAYEGALVLDRESPFEGFSKNFWCLDFVQLEKRAVNPTETNIIGALTFRRCAANISVSPRLGSLPNSDSISVAVGFQK